MTGIYLLFVVALWSGFVAWASIAGAKLLPSRIWQGPVALIVFVAVLPLPLIDELIGSIQFNNICKQHDKIFYDKNFASGKTVFLDQVKHVPLENLSVPVTMDEWRFLDAATNKPVLSYEIFHAGGGKFIRAIGISEGNAPLIFKNRCEPGGKFDYIEFFRNQKINLVAKSRIIKGIEK